MRFWYEMHIRNSVILACCCLFFVVFFLGGRGWGLRLHRFLFIAHARSKSSDESARMQPSLLAVAISTCTIANIFFEGSMRRDLFLFIPAIRMAICMKSQLN